MWPFNPPVTICLAIELATFTNWSPSLGVIFTLCIVVVPPCILVEINYARDYYAKTFH
jgi:hypothetical protein